MNIVSAISLALALACFLCVHYAEAACENAMSCAECRNYVACAWCAMTFPIPNEDGVVFDTTIGYCIDNEDICILDKLSPPLTVRAARQLSPTHSDPVERKVVDCPADEIGRITSNGVCESCINNDNSFCAVVTGYPGSAAPTRSGGFCLSKAKANLCTPATFPLHSKAYPGATLAISAPKDATDCCNLYRTCADCPADGNCSWCALELTDDAKHVTSGFGICMFADGPPQTTTCPAVPPQLSAMTIGLSLAPAVGWATRYIPIGECKNEVPAYSTGAWSSFKTRAACDSNPNTAWCNLTGVARTAATETTPLNSGGICVDLFASGFCHAGWYLYPSPLTVGFELDGRF